MILHSQNIVGFKTFNTGSFGFCIQIFALPSSRLIEVYFDITNIFPTALNLQ